MSQKRRKEILAILESVLELPEEGRSDYLIDRCKNDPELLHEVEARLEIETKGVFDNPIPAAVSTDLIGRQLGAYRVISELGTGGMGSVYLASRDDGRVKMNVAVKMVRHSLAFGGFLDQFYRERQTLADLKHPHIAMLLDVGELDGQPYFIMENIEGQNINHWCESEKPDLHTLLQVFRRIVAAVGFAHDKGFIHRDIKPGNLMVSRSGEPKLLDFGISEMVSSLSAQNQSKGAMAMTPEYASPEQKAGGEVGVQSDIYSLALVLLELVTGKMPSEAADTPQQAVESLLLRTEPGLLADAVPETLHQLRLVDEEQLESLGHVLRTALAASAAFRYQAADEFLADLDVLINTLPPTPKSKPFKSYDVLIWNHLSDHGLIETLADHLSDSGLKVWTGWGVDDELEHAAAAISALTDTKSCLVCLGPGDHIPWIEDIVFRESLSFLSGRVRIVPLLLPGAAFPEKSSDLPKFLRGLAWITFPEGLVPAGMDPVVALLKDDPLKPDRTLHEVCPFRGLEVFREQDRHYFFGREAITQRILMHLQKQAFIAVLGPSGSGKSSIVQAGVMAELRSMGHAALLFSPAREPLRALGLVLVAFCAEKGLNLSLDFILAKLRKGPKALHQLGLELAPSAKSGRILVVIDQFEELFTLVESEPVRQKFIDNLCYAIDQEDSPFLILLTMRSDFFGCYAAYPELNRYVTDHLVHVEAMSSDDLYRAVNIPTQLAGLEFEPGLLERILDDLAGSAGELPLLEHALLELYRRRVGGMLTREAYESIGGIAGALAQRAETEYEALDDTARQTLRRMFTLCLVQPGEGVQDTRRRAGRAELLAVSSSVDVVENLLTDWTEARLLTAWGDSSSHDNMYDVAHEALIREWPRIREWMLEDRETARLMNRLRQYARTWRESDSGADHLLRGAVLMQMCELKDQQTNHLGEAEASFLNASLAQQGVEERKKRRTRNALAGLGMVGILLAMATSLLYYRASQAEQVAISERETAIHARDMADERTKESNYNLGLAFNEKAGDALDAGDPIRAWLYTFAALSREIADDKTLTQPMGRLLDPRIKGVEQFLWTSPVSPVLTLVQTTLDGRRLAIVDNTNQVQILDTLTGIRQSVFAPLAGITTTMVFGPDGSTLVLGGEKGEMFVVSGSNIKTLDPNQIDKINDIAFSEDGALFAAGDSQGQIQIYGFPNPEILNHFKQESSVQSLAYLGNHFYGGFADGSVWSLPSKKDEPTVQIWAPGASSVAGIHPDGSNLLVAFADGNLVLLDPSGRLLQQETFGQDIVSFTADRGTLLLTSTEPGYWVGEGLDGPYRFYPHEGAVHGLSIRDRMITGFDDKGRLFRQSLLQEKEQALLGHRDLVYKTAYSPDGRLLASGSWDNDIILWNLGDPSSREGPPRVLKGHEWSIFGLSFSPDGSRLASASADKTVRIWSLLPGMESSPPLVLASKGVVYDVAFSPDGKLLATACRDHSVKVWDVSGAGMPLEVAELCVFGNRAVDVVFSSDSRMLAACSADKAIYLWQLFPGQEIGEPMVLLGHTGSVNSIAFSPDDQFLSSTAADRTVRIWDVSLRQKPQVVEVFQELGIDSFEARFSQDGRILYTTTWDNHLNMIAVQPEKKSKLIQYLEIHNTPPVKLDISPDTTKMVAGYADGSVKMWDSAPAEPLQQTGVLKGHSDIVTAAVFSQDGKLLATSSNDKTIGLWDVESDVIFKPRNTLYGHSDVVGRVAFSADGKFLVSASHDKTARVWDLQSNPPVTKRVLEGHGGRVEDACFFSDGDYLASVSEDGSLRVWNFRDDNAKPQTLSDHNGLINSLALSPTQLRLATCSSDQTVIIWDLQEPDAVGLKQVLRGHNKSVSAAAYSPDGRFLASSSDDKTVRIWDAHSGRVEKILRGFQNTSSGLAFSPNGRWLAIGLGDKTVRIWDLWHDREIANLSGRGHDLGRYFSFSPDGRLLAVPSGDKTVHLWRMDGLISPPAHTDETEWYQEIYWRSLYQMGYRMDGLELIPQSRVRLQGVNYLLEPTPYDHLDHPRPQHMPYLEWLMQDRLPQNEKVDP